MAGVLPSTVFLGLAVLGALVLARRPWPAGRVGERNAASRALAVALACQGLHFLEEATTGFPERFGPLLGVAEMPVGLFLSFNLAWLAIWIAAVWGVRSAMGWAVFAAWFLGIAGALNGVAHPALAIAAGGYFPGLVSAPIVGAASAWLLTRLTRASTPRSPIRR